MFLSKDLGDGAIVLAMLGCTSPQPSGANVPVVARALPEAGTPAPGASTSGVDAGAPSSAAARSAAATPAKDESDASAARPAPITRAGKVWPFHPWDHAEAVAFNAFAMRPGVQLRAYDESGWTKHLVDRKPISDAQARQAVDLVGKTDGDVEVSKCPFPRHAVVLYDGAVPVASINVCFSCGDIMLWPRWSPAPDWDSMTDKQMKEHALRSERQMKLYEKVFPSWKTFFRDEIGFPIDGDYR